MQLLLYSPTVSPRLRYIINVLCQAGGIQQYELTTDKLIFIDASCCKINYSAEAISSNECHVVPVALLFETGITQQQVDCFNWQGYTAFFKSDGDVPFDILAASFYLLSRYEEYLPFNPDAFGRYAHSDSIAFTNHFLQLPLVNLWAQLLTSILHEKFPGLQVSPPTWSYLATYDIDMAWSYYGKGFTRNLGGLAREVLTGQTSWARRRIQYLLAYAGDPFDVYEWLDQLHQKHHLTPIYFFLVAAKAGRYDKNVSPQHQGFQLLLQKLSVMYPVGLHPSWQSEHRPSLLYSEKQLLEHITGIRINRSRQHYIQMQLPGTYRRLLQAGITHDYSMGYGSINGFRASYCLPFYWYDVAAEEETKLLIHPFCYMEANSIFEQKLTHEDALAEMKHYLHITRVVKGEMITIFHNHLLSTEPQQQAWRNMYEQFLAMLSS